MAIRLTRIYTRTGDEGERHLGDGSRTSKSDPGLSAYADCDETNAVLGLVLALGHVAAVHDHSLGAHTGGRLAGLLEDLAGRDADPVVG